MSWHPLTVLVLLGVMLEARAAQADRVSTSVDEIALSGDGRHGDAQHIDWIRESDTGNVIDVGATHKELAGMRLFLLRGLGVLTRPGAWKFSGEVQAGPIATSSSRDTFALLGMGAIYVPSPRSAFSFGMRYSDGGAVTCALLNVQATQALSRALTAQIGLGQSVAGTLTSHYASARLDYFVRGARLYAGGSVGNGAVSGIDLGAVVRNRFADGFAGLELPAGRLRIGLTLDSLALHTDRVQTLTLSASMPITRGS